MMPEYENENENEEVKSAVSCLFTLVLFYKTHTR